MIRRTRRRRAGGRVSRAGLALVGFLAIAGFFLFGEHQAHLLGALPFVLLLLCPLLHVFGHGGHGAHGESHKHSGEREP
ncbi:MAG TPA: DUF2933 domain-containing protein [Acidiferrobacterales bacterium]